MIFYIKKRDGRIFKGKSHTGKWDEVFRGMDIGDRLYNPNTRQTVIGWNLYKQQMASVQKKKYGK